MTRPLQFQSRLGVQCPHCGSPAASRTSTTLTKLYREIQYQCSNAECGHTFLAALSILRTICPSRQPDPTIHLPILPATMARAARLAGMREAANDPLPAPANDGKPATERIPDPPAAAAG